jgi:heptosyltransferase-2
MIIASHSVHSDCRHFKGDQPCLPHKEHGVHCATCSMYKPSEGIILIVKLGALGDVIRTTPLLYKLRKEFPNHRIWWITHASQILPTHAIDKILPFSFASYITLQATEFDIVINLDKDPEACGLTSMLKAKQLWGFTLHNGLPAPANALAEQKFLTGIFDDCNQANTLSYVQEIFAICGWEFQGEEYIMNPPQQLPFDIPAANRKIIGLNTGCGERWLSRLWPKEHWEKLIALLFEHGYFPVLLGGAQEAELNEYLAATTGAYYPGTYPLPEFIALMNSCDVIISAVTMAMHVAIGLRKPLVLFVNIFNPHEFELYGRGTIIQPETPCECFFSPACKRSVGSCMHSLQPEVVMREISQLLPIETVKEID